MFDYKSKKEGGNKDQISILNRNQAKPLKNLNKVWYY